MNDEMTEHKVTSSIPVSGSRMVPTMADEQAGALQDEFPEFQVWEDFRPMEDGDKHWHARQSDWTVEQIISAYDADDMRRELIIYRRQNGNPDE